MPWQRQRARRAEGRARRGETSRLKRVLPGTRGSPIKSVRIQRNALRSANRVASFACCQEALFPATLVASAPSRRLSVVALTGEPHVLPPSLRATPLACGWSPRRASPPLRAPGRLSIGRLTSAHCSHACADQRRSRRVGYRSRVAVSAGFVIPERGVCFETAQAAALNCGADVEPSLLGAPR